MLLECPKVQPRMPTAPRGRSRRCTQVILHAVDFGTNRASNTVMLSGPPAWLASSIR
jgi:hypothetical protein